MKPKKKILNVGCGKEYYGTDFIDKYPTRDGIKRCDANCDKFPYQDNYFDEVYSNNLFEHLTNISHFLKECKRVLKRNGRLVIITDNAGLWGLFGNAHYGTYERQGSDDMHYSLFTPRHLNNWLNKFGFTDIKVEYCIQKRKTCKLWHFVAMKIAFIFNKRMGPSIKATAIKEE